MTVPRVSPVTVPRECPQRVSPESIPREYPQRVYCIQRSSTHIRTYVYIQTTIHRDSLQEMAEKAFDREQGSSYTVKPEEWDQLRTSGPLTGQEQGGEASQ